MTLAPSMPCTLPPEELPAAWRRFAAQIEPFGPEAANAFRRAADDLAASLEARACEALTLAEAATESGYSQDHLERLVRTGQLHNAGKRGAPRIRRGDLPRRAGALPSAGSETILSVPKRQLAQAVVNSSPRSSDNA